MNWPVNYTEQSLTVDKLRKQLDRAKSANTTVIIHNFRQPTQKDWETAFITQTGQQLPIPPGTRLRWIDPRSGLTHSFSTIHDVNSGKTTSGTVYKTPSPEYERGALRLIGSVRGWTDLASVTEQSFFNATNERWEGQLALTGLMPLDVITETQRGLLNLLFIGKIRTNLSMGFAVPSFEGSKGTSAYEFQQMAVATNAATTYPAPVSSNLVLNSWAASGLPGYFTTILLQISGSALRTASGVMQLPRGGVNTIGLSASFGVAGSLASGVMQVEMDSYHIALFNPILNGVRTFFNFAGNSNQSMKLFCYGLYANNELYGGVHP